jgi:hypothetical protein
MERPSRPPRRLMLCPFKGRLGTTWPGPGSGPDPHHLRGLWWWSRVSQGSAGLGDGPGRETCHRDALWLWCPHGRPRRGAPRASCGLATRDATSGRRYHNTLTMAARSHSRRHVERHRPGSVKDSSVEVSSGCATYRCWCVLCRPCCLYATVSVAGCGIRPRRLPCSHQASSSAKVTDVRHADVVYRRDARGVPCTSPMATSTVT